mmetsp:Transcript_11488/g.35574  ORF Transcript_11488/g.35574 Transcript_11488/m.35574 type:complete len:617 (-) Transcript_11488:32-1882(-)
MAGEGGGGQEANAGGLCGRRVCVAGSLATVRWGPGHLAAPPAKAPPAAPATEGSQEGQSPTPAPQPATVEVVGIEYDDAGLGKHNGTYQGTQLFTCKDGHGSFVKLEKVQFGVPIQQALAEKYFAGLMPEAASKSTRAEAVNAMEYVDSKGREKAMTVELVGRYGVEQRQQRLEGFIEMALADTCLETRYPEDVWAGDWSLPNLKSLWLDKTMLNDWADVVAICELCPQLEWLSLARTRLAPPPPGGQLPIPKNAPTDRCDQRLVLQPFVCRVRTLVMTSTMVTWEALLAIDAAGLFPSLEHLHLAHNNLTEGIPELEQGAGAEQRCPFPKLKSLVLDGNGIQDWLVIRRAISTFPSLEALHLNGNHLGETLEGLSELAADATPRRLTALFLNENRLSSWRAIGALSAYALLELRAQRIPLTEGEAPLASPMLLRQVLIAMMPTLLRLNASEVTVKERTAAERYFLTLAQQPDSSVVQGLTEMCDIAGHVARLRGIHGDIVGGGSTEEAQASRSALRNALVEVTLRPVGSAILDQHPVKKRLPHTMTVAELRRLSQLLFRQVPLDRVQLVLSDPGLPFGMPFEDESRELGFYGVGDGAEIHVSDTADHVPLTRRGG